MGKESFAIRKSKKKIGNGKSGKAKND